MNGTALAWTIPAAIGLVLALYLLIASARDLWHIRHVTPNGRRLLAFGHVRREAFRVLLQLDWTIIGVASLLGFFSFGFLIALIITPSIVALNSLLDILQRHQEEEEFGRNRG